MQRNRTSLRATLPICLTVGLSASVALAGCDKGKEAGGDDDGKTEAKAEDGKAEDGKAEDGKAEDGKAGGEDQAKIAALEAEKEAMEEALKAAKEQNEKLAEELDQPIEAEDDVAHEKALEEGKKGPLSLANVSITQDEPRYGAAAGRKTLKIATDITLNEKKDGALYAKASCKAGDEVYADVVTVSSKYGELGKMNEGDTKNENATAFVRSGLAEAPTKCQVSFDYGGSEFSVRLADYCWDGSTVTDGKCEGGLGAAPKGTGAVVPFGYDIKVDEARFTMDGSTDKKVVHAYYSARINEPIEKAIRMSQKTACKVGDKIWVAISPDFPHVKPFTMENGEAFQLGHSQFMSDPLPGEPEWCQIDVLQSEGFSSEEKSIGVACWKPGGEVADGSCRDMPEKGEIEEVTADTMTVDKVGWMWKKDYKKPEKAVLQLQFEVTMNKPVEQWTRLRADVACNGKADKEHRFGPDLSQVWPTESFGVNMSAFWRDPQDPGTDKCEIKISTEKMGKDPAEVATMCIRGDKLSKGACKKAKKGKKAEVDQFFSGELGK